MTTLQNIISTIRNSGIVPPTQVNYGWTDNLKPPYLAVTDFEYGIVYQTCGDAIRHSTFHVICFDINSDNAESNALKVLALLDTSTTLTPSTSRCLLEHYKVGQMKEELYQWGVDLQFRLEESI